MLRIGLSLGRHTSCTWSRPQGVHATRPRRCSRRLAKNPALPSSSVLTCTNWPAMLYLAAWAPPTSTKSRLSTGDDVTTLLLVILAGASATSFHPARTTRRRRGDGGGVALVVRGVAKEGTKD